VITDVVDLSGDCDSDADTTAPAAAAATDAAATAAGTSAATVAATGATAAQTATAAAAGGAKQKATRSANKRLRSSAGDLALTHALHTVCYYSCICIAIALKSPHHFVFRNSSQRVCAAVCSKFCC
jgi:hypothetical protein